MKHKLDSRYKYKGTINHVKMKDDCVRARDRFIEEVIEKDLIEQSCYVCDANNFKRIGEVDRYGFYYPTGMCEKCGNIQQEKYYDKKTIELFYSKYYYQIYASVEPKSLFNDQIRRRALPIFEFLKDVSNPKKVLEVGCGAGGNLSKYVNIGCEVLGLDLDVNLLEYALTKKIPAKKGSIELLRPNEKFDLIILSHFLEHLLNPSQFLKTLCNHLNDEGIVYIEVPSIDNVKNGGYNYDLLNYFQNAHTIHFTTKSLNLICKKAGLKPKKKMSTFIRSCWVKTIDATIILEDEKVDSLKHSKYLLNTIEANQKSFK